MGGNDPMTLLNKTNEEQLKEARLQTQYLAKQAKAEPAAFSLS